MSDYFPRISKRERNVVWTHGGNIYVGYQITPPAVNPYDDRTIVAAQRLNDMMLQGLSRIDTDHVFLGGFLAKTPLSEMFGRIVRGIPHFSNENYPEALDTLREFGRMVESGFINERQRLFFVYVRYPMRTTAWSRFSASLFDANPFENTKDSDIVAFAQKVKSAIPDALMPAETVPEHLDWFFDRATLRGISVPDAPDTAQRPVVPGNRAFPEVNLDEAAVGTSLLDDYIERYLDGDPRVTDLKDGFRRNFRDIKDASLISVTRPDTANASFPQGITSYQGVFAMTGYPSRPDYGFQNFTGIVDQATGMDGDFVMHLSFAPHMTDNAALNKTLRNLSDEDISNTRTELDAADYGDRYAEVADYHNAIRSESDPVAVRVTTLFAFAAANLEYAHDTLRNIRAALEGDGFRVSQFMGGKLEMWKSMLPCYPMDAVNEQLAGLTTATLFGGYAPVRRYRIGDGVGVPVAVNIGNALGQIIHMDLLNATERGNASIAITGAQGKGKSHLMKVIMQWMNDLRQRTVALDSQGEWATFVQEFTSHQIIDMANPTVSLDVLKVVKDPRRASAMLEQLLIGMFGISSTSETAAHISEMITPDNRELLGLNTTRKVLEAMAAATDDRFREVRGIVRSMLHTPTMGALIDPEVDGRVYDLPAANLTAHNIVFLTRGLKLPTPDKRPEDHLPIERYTLMANTAVAMITAYFFEGKRESCAFFGDEMSFYKDVPVLRSLVQEPDRTGRKFGNFVVVGSQTAPELSTDEYRLVRKRIALGQEKEDNSRDALEWANFEATPELIREHIFDTSPLDPSNDNLPMEGREGEGYFNDGTVEGRGRIRVLPHLSESRARASDTRTSAFMSNHVGDVTHDA